MPQRIVFMGTPDFAVPALEQLIESPYQVVGVYTQPDRASGRGRKISQSPVKAVALAAGLAVLQPPSLKDPAAVAQLAALQADLIVVAAFGQILRSTVLDLPPYGCINIHASLLPRWRGAAPVAAAIRAGDEETGITLMQMDPGLDTGPIIRQQGITINADHTRATLTADLARLGAGLLTETLPDWFAGRITPQAQDDHLATLAPSLKKTAGRIDWLEPAAAIERQVRAMDPWPGTFTTWQDQPLKIAAVSVAADDAASRNLPPGRVCLRKGVVTVKAGEGVIVLETIQPAGKRAMPATAFINGAPNFNGSQLGQP